MRRGVWVGNRDPLVDGCPCPACRHHDRDYISYLSRAEELTAARLIVLPNPTAMHAQHSHDRARVSSTNTGWVFSQVPPLGMQLASTADESRSRERERTPSSLNLLGWVERR